MKTIKQIHIFTIAFAAILILQTQAVRAAWGDFDPSFGFLGVAVDPVTGYHPQSVAIQPDGKILVTGYRTTTFGTRDFFLRRYLSNGQLDNTFGKNGAAISPEAMSPTSDYHGENIVVQSNGKIAVSGAANDYYAVWQFTSNGRNDTAFGQNGLRVLTQYPRNGNIFPEINIQNGKILLTLHKVIGDGFRIVLIRLNSSGAIDPTFGNLGEALTNFYGPLTVGQLYFGTIVESNGKITIGSKSNIEDLYEKGLERKLANGQTDLSFSPTPSYSGGFDFLPGLVKTTDVKYVMRSFNLGASLTLYLDKFSSIGVFESSLSPISLVSGSWCPDVFTSQNDGRILIGFWGILLRLNSNLDSNTLETNYCSNLNGFSSIARAALQPDDKLVSAGIYNNHLMLVRLLPN